MLELIDGTRDVQGIIDASGLVEFEVGKALLGLLNAGFIHRIGKTAPRARRGRERPRRGASQPRRRVLQDRHVRGGVARVPARDRAARATTPSARFYVGLVLRAPDESGRTRSAALTECASRSRPRRPAVFHNLAYVLEQQHRYDEARAALQTAIERGGANGPARADVARRRVSAHRRSRRRRRRADGARGRCSAPSRRRRRGFTTPRSPPRSAATPGAPRRSSPTAWPRIRTPRCSSTTSRRCSSGSATTTPRRGRGARPARGRRRRAAAQEPRRPALSRRALRRSARGVLARDQAPTPSSGARHLPQARQHPASPAGARGSAALLGARARARPRQRDRAHEPRVGPPGILMVERAPGDFLALTRKISRRARLRLRELQGEVPAAADRGAHARARRAHVRRLRARARRRRGRVRPPARRADDQRHQAVPELGGVRAIATHVVPALWSPPDCPRFACGAPGARPGDEPYSLAVLFHRHADQSARARAACRASTCWGRTSTAGRSRRRGAASSTEPDFADTPRRPARALLLADAAVHGRRRRCASMVRFETRDLLAEPAPARTAPI